MFSSREGDGLREEIKRATQANLARLDRPETIRVNHLLFHRIDPDTRKELPPEAQQAKRELAGKTLVRLKAGEELPAALLGDLHRFPYGRVGQPWSGPEEA